MKKIILPILIFVISFSLKAQTCSSNFEPNETQVTAASIALGVLNFAAIDTSTDKDFYKITTTSTSNIVYNLVGPTGVDFDLFVYNAAGTQIGGALTISATETISLLNQAAGTYYIKVIGFNGASSANCYTIKATTSVSITCNAPANLTTSAITNTSASINWAAVTGALSFAVEYKLSTDSIWTSASTTATSLALSGLATASIYNWRVKSICDSSNTSTFATSQFTTGIVSICGDNFEPNETQATAAAIALGVSIAAAITSSIDVDFYKITTTTTSNIVYSLVGPTGVDFDLFVYNAVGTQIGLALTVSSTETITLLNQVAGTYYIKVMGFNGAVSSNCYTIMASITTTNNCASPTNLAATAITNTGASLSWAAVTGALSYTVQYKLSTDSIWTSASTSATSLTLSGLTTASIYNWRVKSDCDSTSSSTFASSQFTTGVVSVCANNFEPNETQATAAFIDLDVLNSAAITATSDVDYFKITNTNVSDIEYNLTGPAGVDFDLFVYNASGAQIGSSISITANETVNLLNQAAGTYYIKVKGFGGAVSSSCYQIKATATAPIVITCNNIYDTVTNGSFAGAALIPFNTFITGTINPIGDKDNYKFVITNGGTITLKLINVPSDYDVKLFNSAGTQVAISQLGGVSNETINYNAIPGTYYAQVYAYGNNYASTSCYALKVQLGTASRQINQAIATTTTAPKSETLDVYPNPASNVLQLLMKEQISSNCNVQILDAKGNVVINQRITRNPQPIDVTVLRAGFYLIKINNGASVIMDRFIKQ